MDETMLDGNAAAGDLQELFAVEVTQMVGVCDGCGRTGPLAEAHVFVARPGPDAALPGLRRRARAARAPAGPHAGRAARTAAARAGQLTTSRSSAVRTPAGMSRGRRSPRSTKTWTNQPSAAGSASSSRNRPIS